jgi:hypothetical protein
MLGAVALAGLLSAQTSSAAPSRSDRSATRAYLKANYAFYRTALANVPASLSAAGVFAAKLESECPNVLVGAPSPMPETATTTPTMLRQSGQAEELELELGFSLLRVSLDPDDVALMRLVHTMRSLHFSQARLTRLMRIQASSIERELSLTVANVCADMTAWVASGYEALAPATREYRNMVEALFKPSSATESLAVVLARQEDRSEKATARRTRRLEDRVDLLTAPEAIEDRLRTALGLKTIAAEEGKPEDR